ncbi:hypothetical protein [Larkinella soli]|uniref:hypothetical protein n=1 Tax=Larkinella soli TaxID=1770527 RepID=UPI000FFC5B99|nr:hypothetical protein [Larkinella soli]
MFFAMLTNDATLARLMECVSTWYACYAASDDWESYGLQKDESARQFAYLIEFLAQMSVEVARKKKLLATQKAEEKVTFYKDMIGRWSGVVDTYKETLDDYKQMNEALITQLKQMRDLYDPQAPSDSGDSTPA